MMHDAPCNGCEQRYVGCHAECAVYADWKIDDLAKRKYIRQNNEALTHMNNYGGRPTGGKWHKKKSGQSDTSSEQWDS